MVNAPALIREAITARSVCLQCIVLKTGVPAATAFYQLDQLNAATTDGRCDHCGESRALYRLT